MFDPYEFGWRDGFWAGAALGIVGSAVVIFLSIQFWPK